MYIIYNHDGSVKLTNLNEYVQKGTNDKSIFIAVEGIATSDYTVTGAYTLPSGETGLLTSTNDTLTLDKETWNGKRLVLTTSFTLYAGVVKLTINLTKNALIWASYNVNIRVNESALDPSATYDFTGAQIQQLFNGWSGKQDTYSVHNMRSYATLDSATADIENLIAGQVIAVTQNGKIHFYVKESAGATALTEKTLDYATDNAVVHKTGSLTETIDGAKTFTSALPKAEGTQGIFTPTADNDLTPKKYVDEEIEKVRARSDVVDVVGTYQDLLNYDTSTLGENDIVKVLKDSTHDNAVSYYRWANNVWTYVGSANVYSKEQTNALLNAKQNKLTAGQNITIENDVISATGGAGGHAQWGDIEGDIDEQTDLVNKLSTKENTSNKTSVLNASSTDVQYPTAKVVYDKVEDVRKVAEGKTNTYIVTYSVVEPTADNWENKNYLIKRKDGTLIDTYEDFVNEITISGTQLTYANGLFNSNDNSVTFAMCYILVNETDGTDFWKTIYKFLANTGTEIKKGDNILVTEINVPDRWFDGYVNMYALETTKVDLSTKQDKLPTDTDGYYKVNNGVISVGIPAKGIDKLPSKDATIPTGLYYTDANYSLTNPTGQLSLQKGLVYWDNTNLTGWALCMHEGYNDAYYGNVRFYELYAKNNLIYIKGFKKVGVSQSFYLYEKLFPNYPSSSTDAYNFRYINGAMQWSVDGLTITDNSITALHCMPEINALTLEANKTFTFINPPSVTGTNLSCKPEYKLLLNITTACNITLPSATYKLVSNNDDIALTDNVIALPVSEKIEISIQDNCIVAYDWSL